MLKRLALYALLILFSNSLSAERIIDEETINSWGYKTVSIKDIQKIKKIEKVNSSGQVYYPRFTIQRECFNSPILANQKLESLIKLQNSPDYKFRDFDYRKGLVQESCLIILNTDAMYFKLEFQPELFEKIKAYLNKS